MLGISCLASYWLINHILPEGYLVHREDKLLGGMWTVISTIFVYRQTHQQSMTAAYSRALATAFSVVLSLVYLLIFPYHIWGMAALIGIASFALTAAGRSDDVATAAITIAVVLVVAAIRPQNAWEQPILRLVDTAVGIAIGIAASWISLSIGLIPTLPVPEKSASSVDKRV